MKRRDDQHLIATLYRTAREIVDKTRGVFAAQGQDAREIRLPVLMQGADLRVTIEAGPKIAARNAIEHAQMQASDRPVAPVDMSHALAEAKALLAQYASEIKDTETVAGQWPEGSQTERRLFGRCMATVQALGEVERLL